MQQKSLLVDTNIVIDYLRNYKPAVNYLEKLSMPLFLSAISVAEIYAGIRNDSEQKSVENFLNAVEILSTDNTIAATGGTFCKKYKNSHGVGLADALIAATALHHNATLATLNTRHFPMIKTIKPYEKK